MRSKRLLPLLAAVLMTTSAVVPAFSQAPATQPTGPDVPTEKLIDLEMSGTNNVRDYVNYLQEITGLNIVLMNEKGTDPQRIEVPPLKLKQMPASAAIMLLSDLPGAHITVEQKDNAFIVVAHAPDLVVGPAGPVDENGRVIQPPITRVFSLEQVFFANSLTDAAPGSADRAKVLADKVPQALKLVEEALSIDGESTADRTLIKLHQPTNTLIVRGTADQLATVEQVLKALAPPISSDEVAVLRSKYREIQGQADQAESFAREAAKHADQQAVALIAKNQQLMQQLLDAQQRIRELSAEREATTRPAAHSSQP